MRERRRARRAQAHAPYTYGLYAYAAPALSLHTTPTRARSTDIPEHTSTPTLAHANMPKQPRTRGIVRAHSDPSATFSTPVQDNGGSDDSFSHLLDEDELDAAAVEELAQREGW